MPLVFFYAVTRRRPTGYAGHAPPSSYRMAAPCEAEGEAWWTGLPGLTINRRSSGPGSRSAQVAQLVEHATENRSVGGSIPPLGTIPV
jgi:hypothetical protein